MRLLSKAFFFINLKVCEDSFQLSFGYSSIFHYVVYQ